VWAAALLFFFIGFVCLAKKINVLQVRWYKNYDKKSGGTASQVCNCLLHWLGGILSSSQKEKDLFFTASVFRYCNG
jgi:hypothetical protein